AGGGDGVGGEDVGGDSRGHVQTALLSAGLWPARPGWVQRRKPFFTTVQRGLNAQEKAQKFRGMCPIAARPGRPLPSCTDRRGWPDKAARRLCPPPRPG